MSQALQTGWAVVKSKVPVEDCENCGKAPATTPMIYAEGGRDSDPQTHHFCADCANELDVGGTGYHRV
tara:strand:+ start:8649 stop:8852 length:204 start_codon:yes stop_codon:yes gene_type:complete